MGTELAGAAVTCPRCGEDRLEGSRFCSRCGLDLAAAAVAAVAPVAVPSVTPPAIPGAGPTTEPAIPPAAASHAPAPAWTPPTPPPPGDTVAWTPPAPGPAAAPAWSPPVFPQATASATGRRASGAGWVAVILGVLVFLVAAIGIVAAATGGIPGLPGSGPAAAARWDRSLHLPGAIVDARAFEIEAEALNDGDAPTDPVWLVVEWRPADIAFDPDAVGRATTCDPRTCQFRNDAATSTTTVFWPGLQAGERRVLSLTVQVSGIEPGQAYVYRVRVGIGPDESSLAGGYTWTPEVEVEAPAAGMKGAGGSG